MRRKLTPPQIAAQYGCAAEKVTGWIKSGELRAINGSSKPGGKPRYLVDIEDLAAFERSRQVAPPSATPRRRKVKSTSVKEFFSLERALNDNETASSDEC